MNTEDAINHLKSLGYKIEAPKAQKKEPNGCYRIGCAGEKGNQFFFMEAPKGEDEQIKNHYISRGYDVLTVEFNKDQFFFYENDNSRAD